jgi:hypothetical protein
MPIFTLYPVTVNIFIGIRHSCSRLLHIPFVGYSVFSSDCTLLGRWELLPCHVCRDQTSGFPDAIDFVRFVFRSLRPYNLVHYQLIRERRNSHWTLYYPGIQRTGEIFLKLLEIFLMLLIESVHQRCRTRPRSSKPSVLCNDRHSTMASSQA